MTHKDRLSVLTNAHVSYWVISLCRFPFDAQEAFDLSCRFEFVYTPKKASWLNMAKGKEATGAMVYFYNGEPDKTNYRKFKIEDVRDINDYTMIREIVHRRYKRLKEEGRTLIDINRDSQLLFFIQQIRDEAHRFALKYHHNLIEKKVGI